MKLFPIIFVICFFVVSIQAKKTEVFGDVENKKFIGFKIISGKSEANGNVERSIKFPEVMDKQNHYQFQREVCILCILIENILIFLNFSLIFSSILLLLVSNIFIVTIRIQKLSYLQDFSAQNKFKLDWSLDSENQFTLNLNSMEKMMYKF